MSAADDWELTSWGRIADLRYGKALRDYRSSGGPVRVFGTNGPVGFTDVAQASGPGVIIGRKGAYRGVHYSPSDFWVIDTAFYLSPKRSLDLRWAFYALQLADINGLDSGSAIPSTTREGFASLQVLVPPLGQQQSIAEVLGALDDKIAANTALASAADELIRAEYDNLGQPNRVRVGDVARSPRDGIDPSNVAPDTAYFGLEHIPRRQMWLSEVGRAADVTSGKSRFEKHDVLFGKLRPYFHKVVSAPSAGICSTDILVLRANESHLSSVLLMALTSDEVVASVVAASEGTRMPRTSWKDLAATEISWPLEEVLQATADRLGAIRDAVQAALAETWTLAATRDALLPQLMSGNLRVRDAEIIASAAGA